jgi:predicted RND superfamily exporter protein
VLALLAGGAATQLQPVTPAELLVSGGSEIGAATRAQEAAFGAEPIVVAAEGDLQGTILATPNLVGLLQLEGQIAELDGVKAVYGPGTFINQTIVQLESVVQEELGPVAEEAAQAADDAREEALASGADEQAAEEAGEAARLEALGPAQEQFEELLVRFGYVGLPSLSNSNFVRALVFGPSQAPKERFSFLFPDAQHALILVRPDSGLPDARLSALGDEIQTLAEAANVQEVKLTVAGAPLVAAAVSAEVRTELIRLAPIVLVVMGLVLLLALRARSALRALLLAAGAALLTAGIAAPLGLGLTPATVAALPVVLGLAVDFAVQLHVRFSAYLDEGHEPVDAARAAAAAVGPVLGLAALAMAAGFLVLTISPIPLVDRLGLMLAVGVLASLVVVMTFGPVLLAAAKGAHVRPPALRLPAGLVRVAGRTGVLAAATLLALAGIALSSQTQVQSDLTELAPGGLPELQRVQELQAALGTSGQLRVAVSGDDVTSPEILEWMAAMQDEIPALRDGVRPGPNLAELLLTGVVGQATPAQIQELLGLVPRYFTSAVLSDDHQRAEISFGVPLLPVAEQAKLLTGIERVLDGAPAGVSAHPAGLVAVAADSVRELESERPWLLLAAFAGVFAVLLIARRNLARAALPLVPALLAAGISSLAILVLGLRLSPLSVGLEPLVLAVGVEFGLLLEARYREAREAGRDPAAAYSETLQRVGTAVAVSAATVALGFLVLVVSRLSLLSQFGALVAVELALCLAAAVLMVPLLARRFDARMGPVA